MFSGAIEGIGPRYCPSIEDKVVRFADKESHQIFLEPEGLDLNEWYPNGISTSLPFDVQMAFVHSIPGLEQCRITRPGYAIEYDFLDPRDLKPGLETRPLQGLFLAGQINGTTGYEEAAAQGLLAGINAARASRGEDGWFPRRHEAYIGVLVDDLVTRGVSEPYRMFTSRAEYRLTLREDNADARLTPMGRELGLVDDARWEAFSEKASRADAERERLRRIVVRPDDLSARDRETLGQDLSREAVALDLLRRPEIDYALLTSLSSVGARDAIDGWPELDEQISAGLDIEARYAGYIERQSREVRRHERQESLRLPADLDYAAVKGLSHEARQRLEASRPDTVGQASRLEGVTPSTVSLLLIHLRKAG